MEFRRHRKQPASDKNLHHFPPRVMVNSKKIGFERRVSQLYNLPTPEPTRFVNGVEFTNCFGIDAGIPLDSQLINSFG